MADFDTNRSWTQQEVDESFSNILDIAKESLDPDLPDFMAVSNLDILASEFIMLHKAITERKSPLPSDWR